MNPRLETMWTPTSHPTPLPRSWPSSVWGTPPEWWTRATAEQSKANALREKLKRTVPLEPEVVSTDPSIPLATFVDAAKSGDALRVHLTPRGGFVLLPSGIPRLRVWIHSSKGCTVTIRGAGLPIPPNTWTALPRITDTLRLELSTLKTGDVIVALDG
jgi:hypothetical protein